jgi:hypothetical protein
MESKRVENGLWRKQRVLVVAEIEKITTNRAPFVSPYAPLADPSSLCFAQ